MYRPCSDYYLQKVGIYQTIKKDPLEELLEESCDFVAVAAGGGGGRHRLGRDVGRARLGIIAETRRGQTRKID